MTKTSLIKSTGVIGFATAISRILGFVRDILIANLFGTNPGAQAFFVAFRIPNSLRDLVGEGAANAAIVPVLTEYRTLSGEKEFLHISRVLFNILFAVLTAMTLIGILFSPIIVRLIAPGFLDDPAKFNLTVKLNRMIFPYLIMIGLTAYSMGVLNTMKHFAAPAFGPCVMNVAMISSALWLCPQIGVSGLVVGVLAGGALQLALNLPAMRGKGIRIDPREGFSHPAAMRIGRLLIPRAMGSAVYQINIFVDTILASLSGIVGVGGVAALYYSNRLIQFPLAIFGLALAQAALPKMSQEFALKDIDKFKDTLSFSLRMVFLAMIPSAFGLAIFGEPIIRILFQRGQFTSYSTAITQSALFFFAFGLTFYAGIKLLVSAFYSMHDTKTPVKTAVVATATNVALNLILMWPLKLGGLALATSISATLNFLLLYMLLAKKIGDFGTLRIAISFLKILLSSAVMMVVLKLLFRDCSGLGAIGLLSAIAAGIIVFALSAIFLNVREIKEPILWILKKG